MQAASLNLSGGHSQWITNVHLESYETESAFHERLYHSYSSALLGKAAEFCKATSDGSDEDKEKTLVIVSAGFDASEFESVGMSRHGRRVPSSFFHRFARDVVRFANSYAGGKVLAVLEGGYSDRALASGSMAMLVGLAESPRFLDKTHIAEEGDEGRWWEERSLVKIEKACRSRNGQIKRLGPRSPVLGSRGAMTGVGAGVDPTTASAPSAVDDADAWLARTVELFAMVESLVLVSDLRPVKVIEQPRTMQLRERKPRGAGTTSTPPSPPVNDAGRFASPSPPLKNATELSHAGAEPSPTDSPDRPPPAALPKVKFVWREGGVQ